VVHSDDTVPVPLDLSHREEVLLAGAERTEAAQDLVDRALLDEDERVRATALGAVARQGRLSSSVVLVGLGDPSPIVRIRAAQLAVEVDDEVVPGLIACLDDVGHVAVAALVTLADRAEASALDAILEVARSTSDPLVHEEAVAALGALGDPAGLEVVLAATEGKPALRRRSVAALGGFDGDEVEQALDRLAEDRDWQVRQAVALLRRPPLDGR
jgi:HEAT repeat protein